MNVIWQLEQATVRDVTLALEQRGTQRAYTTIMTTCIRLARKGLLQRRRDRKTDVYWPAISKLDHLHARVVSTVDALIDETGAAALVHFVRRLDAMSPKLRAEVEALARKTQPET